MAVARNMKEIEEMVLAGMKKKLPSVTKDYCHKWYNKNPELNEIVSEEDFIKMVDDSIKISMSNGKLNAKFEIFKNNDIKEEHYDQMKLLWKDFKAGYLDYIYTQIFKTKQSKWSIKTEK